MSSQGRSCGPFVGANLAAPRQGMIAMPEFKIGKWGGPTARWTIAAKPVGGLAQTRRQFGDLKIDQEIDGTR